MGGLDLGASGIVKGHVHYTDTTLALHCIACIAIHNGGGSKGQYLSFRQITEADDVMRTSDNQLVREYLCTFGNQSLPMLPRFLEKSGLTEEQISEKVTKIIETINAKINIT